MVSVVVVLAGLALRRVHWSSSVLLFVVGLSGIILLVPLVISLVALARVRRPLLGISVGLATVWYLATFGNIHAVVGCGQEQATDQIVVFHQNVYVERGDAEGVARAIVAAKADVVDLVEVWPGFMETLARQPGMEAYPYRSSDPKDQPSGVALWSRWPTSGTITEIHAKQPFIHTTIDSPYGSFVFHAVHVSSPVDSVGVQEWSDQLSWLASIDKSQPTIESGDFNATASHAQFRAILGNGWTDAAAVKGCGTDLTWPVNRGTGVPLFRLDHVLVNNRFQVLGVHLGDANGSDHRPVIATLRLSGPPVR